MTRGHLIAVVTMATLNSACATLFSKPTDDITIKSDPSGARVYIGANPVGRTPIVYTFDRETFDHKYVMLKLDGYESKRFYLQKSVDPISFFNFGFFPTCFGATSWGIDAMTGSMSKYSPDSYFFDLVPQEEDDASRAGRLRSSRQRHFAIRNFNQLQRNIAIGDGAYLRSYYELDARPGGYSSFLQEVTDKADILLDQPHGLDLHEQLILLGT